MPSLLTVTATESAPKDGKASHFHLFLFIFNSHIQKDPTKVQEVMDLTQQTVAQTVRSGFLLTLLIYIRSMSDLLH